MAARREATTVLLIPLGLGAFLFGAAIVVATLCDQDVHHPGGSPRKRRNEQRPND
jgi:hypothetical protein